MTVKRMDNVGIVVEDIDADIGFFTELGLKLEGRAPIEGDWAGRHRIARHARRDCHSAYADGHSRLEISRFLSPPLISDHRDAPVNVLGYLRVMFTVEDIKENLEVVWHNGLQGGQYKGADLYITTLLAQFPTPQGNMFTPPALDDAASNEAPK